MKDKFKTLLERTEKLAPLKPEELDDIIVNAEMYINHAFKDYASKYYMQISNISFIPHFKAPSDVDRLNYWQKGRVELENFLKRCIKELELVEELENKDKEAPSTKKAPVENTSIINDLEEKLENLRKKKNLWERINWFALIPILIGLIGGAYVLGIDNGKNKYDTEKNRLYEENIELTKKNLELEKSVKNITSKFDKSQAELKKMKDSNVVKK